MFDCVLFIPYLALCVSIVLDIFIRILNNVRNEKESPKFVHSIINCLCHIRDICAFVFVVTTLTLCIFPLTYA